MIHEVGDLRGAPRVLDQAEGEGWSLINGDSAEVIREIPDRSMGLSLFSPPFSQLYTYSGSDRDMGNCADDAEFFKHYDFLLPDLYRITRPGRHVAVHCKDLVNYTGSSGRAGLRDFPGALIRAHTRCRLESCTAPLLERYEGLCGHGLFTLASRVTIWKCPVCEQNRTNAQGLLYNQLLRDSSYARAGLPDYLLMFRRWATEEEEIEPVRHTEQSFPLPQWQEWASPVWMKINQTDVLNVIEARDNDDEKHLCPLQLDLIERVVKLYSNPGDVVFSPFAGIGSEGVPALKFGRRFLGIELKPSYFKSGVRNLSDANRQQDLFGGAA